jgi:hypothetical protein
MLVRGAQKADRDLRLRADWRIILSRESWQNLAEWEGSERPPITLDTQPVLSDAILVTLLFRMLPRRSL